ncbi:unnamed protein product, partial [Durusdinium trenchii]
MPLSDLYMGHEKLETKTPQCIAWLDTWRQKIPAFASALDRFAAGLRRQLVVGTGCSGTGAPSHALDQLLP